MMETTIATGLLGLMKGFLWALLSLLILFAAIVVRQVHLMNRVLSVPISRGLNAVALGFLLLAVGIFVVSLIVL